MKEEVLVVVELVGREAGDLAALLLWWGLKRMEVDPHDCFDIVVAGLEEESQQTDCLRESLNGAVINNAEKGREEVSRKFVSYCFKVNVLERTGELPGPFKPID